MADSANAGQSADFPTLERYAVYIALHGREPTELLAIRELLDSLEVASRKDDSIRVAFGTALHALRAYGDTRGLA